MVRVLRVRLRWRVLLLPVWQTSLTMTMTQALDVKLVVQLEKLIQHLVPLPLTRVRFVPLVKSLSVLRKLALTAARVFTRIKVTSLPLLAKVA